MAIRRYSKLEPQVFAWVIGPYIIVLNLLMFGFCVFDSPVVFIKNVLFTSIYLLGCYFIFGSVAVAVKRKNPFAGDMIRRIFIMLPLFYLLNCLFIPGIFYLYTRFDIIACTVRKDMLLWTTIAACIMSTVITFINEGIANWEVWKNSLTETERLANVYQRSRVLGLKAQLNPHFLFNCFNTLSGLIADDEEKAEKFLDEMTKVHRYLLRSGEELLVPLETELKFAESYLFLAKERFGGAIHPESSISPDALQLRLPPLSLHVILDNIIYTNSLSKSTPLTINLTITEDKFLCIENSVHEKKIVQELYIEEGLDNLLRKYKMLGSSDIRIIENLRKRRILLPLFSHKQEAI